MKITLTKKNGSISKLIMAFVLAVFINILLKDNSTPIIPDPN